jgi:S-adenosylmethionine decarboxylase
MLDCRECDINAMTDSTTVANFAKKLVKDIDMIAYGEPQIVNFGSGAAQGFTLVQLIETSNVCAHFANGPREIYLDVFSCKYFNQDIVIDLVNLYFKPQGVKVNYVTRQA